MRNRWRNGVKSRMKAKLKFLPLALLVVSCGKSVNLSDLEVRHLEDLCGPDNVARWSFVQPEAIVNRSVDLLIVVDSSRSLADDRSKIATQLPSFLSALPAEADLRIAVMQGHGGASRYSGRLYSAGGDEFKVLDVSKHSMSVIQHELEDSLTSRVSDVDQANGEALMYSLSRSLEADRLAEIKAQGFYRDSAALSVVFITDENDLCFKPEDHGYTTFPDYSVSPNGYEAEGFRKHCAGITPVSVASKLAALKGNQKLSLGGIIHVDPARVPKGSEEAIGHGVLELVSSFQDRSERSGLLWDVTDTDYAQGLTQLGNIVSTQLNLLTQFNLSGAEGKRLQWIFVEVDGKSVAYSYDPDLNELEISPLAAGKAGSRINVAACRQ